MDQTDYIKELENECKLRGFSVQTIRSYSFWVSRFLQFCNKSSLNLDHQSVKYYLLSLDNATNTHRLAYAAIRFFFAHVLRKPIPLDEVPTKKREKQLPKALSKGEILSMVDNTKNIKHGIIIKLLYSTGIRLQELINLKRSDIDFDRKIVNIRKGKGNKDRVSLLSESLILDLVKYYSQYEFKTPYILEGRKGKYSKKSVQKVLEKAGKSINKEVTPHMLRHSFATHLLDQGIDIAYIRKLLGHSRIETTQIYLNLSNRDISMIKNPLD